MTRDDGVADTQLDVLAFGAHPDDVEIGCGATLAKLVRAGKKVGIVHLTRGELGSRGTPEQRVAEAETAAELLGAVYLEFLDCGDGSLRTAEREENDIIEVLRAARPRIVLIPPEVDRHPDHRRAHRLVRDACFYSGLAKRRAPRDAAEPHRPSLVLSYMIHSPFEPSLVVDVSSTWQVKLEALAAYGSQLTMDSGPIEPSSGPETRVSSPKFFQAIVGRSQAFGELIGAEFGEPFKAAHPVAVHDLFEILPGGIA